jgi:uncharacterized protein YecE (DUF72 family)
LAAGAAQSRHIRIDALVFAGLDQISLMPDAGRPVLADSAVEGRPGGKMCCVRGVCIGDELVETLPILLNQSDATRQVGPRRERPGPPDSAATPAAFAAWPEIPAAICVARSAYCESHASRNRTSRSVRAVSRPTNIVAMMAPRAFAQAAARLYAFSSRSQHFGEAQGDTMPRQSHIYIGVGGWTYEPWRGSFYPTDLPQKRELEHMSRALTSIEINGTYYGSQKPESFIKWREETPANFIFSVKGPRFATNRRALAESADSIARFFASGVLELKDKLGPINWQFMATKKFDAEDFGKFLALLPTEIGGRKIRHAVEVRHESFRTPAFVALARKHRVAIVIAGDSEFPSIPDITADFVYLRIMGTQEKPKTGYSTKALDQWAERANIFAAGSVPKDLESIASPAAKTPRDVFLYVISGFKENNPRAAEALIGRLEKEI